MSNNGKQRKATCKVTYALLSKLDGTLYDKDYTCRNCLLLLIVIFPDTRAIYGIK